MGVQFISKMLKVVVSWICHSNFASKPNSKMIGVPNRMKTTFKSMAYILDLVL
jgi:hypothetical protein